MRQPIRHSLTALAVLAIFGLGVLADAEGDKKKPALPPEIDKEWRLAARLQWVPRKTVRALNSQPQDEGKADFPVFRLA
jgi:hypothetical protein